MPGSSGQTASRIILQLLMAGYNVVAGAPDAEQAARAVAFGKKYEILSKDQVGRGLASCVLLRGHIWCIAPPDAKASKPASHL
jgi:hypothetical protein